MRKIYFLIPLFIFSILMNSCFEDQSSLNHRLMNSIIIDMGGASTDYVVFAYNRLTIKPIVYKEGVEDAQLSYQWTLQGNLIEPTVIGTNMTLDTIIDVRPEGNAYKLVFEVTDKTTDIKVEQVFNVSVRSVFGSGLVVCDTKDEQTSDVSLIMAYNFTSGLKQSKEQDTIMHDLFSRVNKRKINGVVTSIRSTIYGVNRSLTIGTNQSVDRVDPFDYSYIDGNGSMFIIDPKNYNVTTIGYEPNSGYELLAISGKLYPRGMQQNNKVYSYYLLTSDMSDYYMGKFCRPDWDNGIGFDEKNGRLLEFDMASRLVVFAPNRWSGNLAFDPNDLSDFTCVAMFTGNNNTLHSILKNKKSGSFYSYVTKRAQWYASNKIENGMPLRIIDLNVCPDIDKALFFDATETQSIIYYATDTKIYAVSIATDDLRVTEEYIAPEGEKITSFMCWKPKSSQGKIDYSNPNPDASDDMKVLSAYNKDRMVVLTTYNQGTGVGTVRAIAIATVGTGTLEKNSLLHGEFSGFGRITSTNVQDAF